MSFVIIRHHSCDYYMCGKYRCSDSMDVKMCGVFDTEEEADTHREILVGD